MSVPSQKQRRSLATIRPGWPYHRGNFRTPRYSSNQFSTLLPCHQPPGMMIRDTFPYYILSPAARLMIRDTFPYYILSPAARLMIRDTFPYYNNECFGSQWENFLQIRRACINAKAHPARITKTALPPGVLPRFSQALSLLLPRIVQAWIGPFWGKPECSAYS